MRVGSLHMNDLHDIQHQSDHVRGCFLSVSVTLISGRRRKVQKVPASPNDCHMFWVYLVGVFILLRRMSARSIK